MFSMHTSLPTIVKPYDLCIFLSLYTFVCCRATRSDINLVCELEDKISIAPWHHMDDKFHKLSRTLLQGFA